MPIKKSLNIRSLNEYTNKQLNQSNYQMAHTPYYIDSAYDNIQRSGIMNGTTDYWNRPSCTYTSVQPSYKPPYVPGYYQMGQSSQYASTPVASTQVIVGPYGQIATLTTYPTYNRPWF